MDSPSTECLRRLYRRRHKKTDAWYRSQACVKRIFHIYGDLGLGCQRAKSCDHNSIIEGFLDSTKGELPKAPSRDAVHVEGRGEERGGDIPSQPTREPGGAS